MKLNDLTGSFFAVLINTAVEEPEKRSLSLFFSGDKSRDNCISLYLVYTLATSYLYPLSSHALSLSLSLFLSRTLLINQSTELSVSSFAISQKAYPRLSLAPLGGVLIVRDFTASGNSIRGLPVRVYLRRTADARVRGRKREKK